MKIFITGESGTIPIAMQRLLIDSKSDIEVVNRQIPDVRLEGLKNHRSFHIRQPEIDFTNERILSECHHILKDVSIIVHSGAYVGTDYCANNPNDAIEANVAGTRNIVEICNKYGISLIYFSTTAIFDPKDYGKDKPITEKTRIDPQTLYGITKYAGEMIVKKLCKTPYTILRPVFGFGDYPDDLHSALTKIIYIVIRNDIFNQSRKLDILLDKDIPKSYTRVENIAKVALQIVNAGLLGYEREEINVGIQYQSAKIWQDLFQIIESCKNSGRPNFRHIIFHPKEDYLHYHNINDHKLFDLCSSSVEQFITLEKGIQMTVDSVMNNINIEPYWL